MAAKDRAFFQRGINMYVPKMQYAAGPIHAVAWKANLGTPATAAAAGVLAATTAQGALATITFFATAVVLDSTYGRTLTYTPSGVPGNANSIEIIGLDYLNQPMVERITGSAAASTLIAGLKAFKTVLGTRLVVAATNAITFTLGTGLSLGLPYKSKLITAKEGTTDLTFATVFSNTVAPVLTDPATALTGDPRGLYTPSSAPNGVLTYEVGLNGDFSVNAAGNGGLHGIRHAAP